MARAPAPKEAVNRVILVAITALSLFFVFLVSRTFLGADKIAIANPSLTTANIARVHQLELDSDGDGVPDWEELLHGTDPFDPTSVWRGGTERNTGTQNASGATPKALTATDAVAHELMGTLMTEYKKGNVRSEQQIVNHALGSLTEFSSTQSTLTFNDLRTVPVSQEAKERYLTSMEDIFKKTGEKSAAEYHALTMIIQGSKKEGVAMLIKSVEAYTFYIEEIMKLAVPEDAVAIHRDVASAVERYRIACQNLTKIESDPVLAMLGLTDFMPSQMHMTEQMKKLAYYRAFFYESLGMLPVELVKQLTGQSEAPLMVTQ